MEGLPLKNDKTYLSKYVHYILVELGRETELQLSQNDHYITKDFIFDWSSIQCLFGDLEDDFNILEQSEIWFIEHLKKVWLIVHDAGKNVNRPRPANKSDSELEKMWELCKFTGHQDELNESFSILNKNSRVERLQIALKLTAILERFLGNIFLMEGKSVPFLLRDLLNTPELKKILGKIPITFMQLLFGSPKGLNIRNVLWHGFILPEELHSSLVYSLFLLFPSIAQLIPTHQDFPVRPQLTNFDEYTKYLKNVFPDNLEHHESILDILDSSQYILSQNFSLWKYSYQLYIQKKYGDCLVLLLPQLEHLLRSVYCDANHCPERLLTAESTTLYTTLDVIMLPYVSQQGSSNNLDLVLGEGLLLMLEDILSLINGPRLRDKLSHGECVLNNIPRTFANHMICIALSVCLKTNRNCQVNMENKFSEITPDLEDTISFNYKNMYLKTFYDTLLDACKNYESKFHIAVKLQRSISDVVSKIENLTNLPVPTEWVQNKLQIDSHVLNLKNRVFGKVNFPLPECVDVLGKYCSQIKLKTLQRPKHEAELIILFINIIKNISLTATKITNGNNERFNQWYAHTLRSRGRQTYQRMHQAVPTLQCALLCLVAIIVALLRELNQTDLDQCQQHTRFSKKMLKIVENTSSFCDFEKNRWNESSKIISDFSESAVEYLELNKIVSL